jgi:DNA polymerase
MQGNPKIAELQQHLVQWLRAGVTEVPADIAELVLEHCRQQLSQVDAATESSPAQTPTAVQPKVMPQAATIVTSPHSTAPVSQTTADTTRAENVAPTQTRTETAVSAAEVSAKPNASSSILFEGKTAGLSVLTELPYPSPLPAEQRSGQLQSLSNTVAACTRCPELCRRRTQTVFGTGTVQPRICFLGEAPGADEDRMGVPFVGAAGQLLDKILAASQLSRDQVYILNVAKCRPPNNRQPTEEEINHCWQYAYEQLEILQPEFIVCLGATAVRGLLKVKYTIPSLREKFHQYRGSRVMVTYHPSYLLRNPDAKKMVWSDMKMLMRELGVQL